MTTTTPAVRFEYADNQLFATSAATGHPEYALADRAALPEDSGTDVAERENLLRELVRRANAYNGPPEMPQATRATLVRLSGQACTLEWGSELQIEADNAFHEIASHYLSEAQLATLERDCYKATTNERLESWCKVLGLPTEQTREVTP